MLENASRRAKTCCLSLSYKEELSSVIAKHSEQKNRLQDLMKLMLESMMIAERREFLDNTEGNKNNGFRQGRSCGK